MKPVKYISILIVFGLLSILLNACYVQKNIAGLSGGELWANNCNRCHNAPGPGELSNKDWDIVGMHMQVRANISGDDSKKIIDFLKSVN
jgi:hypothetical protein